MVNAHDQIYVERHGKLERDRGDVPRQRAPDAHHRQDRLAGRQARRRVVADGRRAPPRRSRVNAIIPPLALRGPTLTIRKFARDPYTMSDLIGFGTITGKAAQFVSACVRGKLNILIAGGTGTGKTTTLNALSAFIPNDERIVTIEDAAELQLQQEHVIVLESRPPNIEGQGEVRIRELVRNALRMRPDRIIVGEVRGAETLDMLQAMNTGHEGSLTTIHANSPRDALSRLETLVLTGGIDLPLRAIREQISSAFDLLIQIQRLVDGSRRITHVTEVLRMESDVITLQDIFDARPPDEEHNPSARPHTAALAARCNGAEAALPREAVYERRRAAAELLRPDEQRPRRRGRPSGRRASTERSSEAVLPRSRLGGGHACARRLGGERSARQRAGRRLQRRRLSAPRREGGDADAGREGAAPERERKADRRPQRREPRRRQERRHRDRHLSIDGGRRLKNAAAAARAFVAASAPTTGSPSSRSAPGRPALRLHELDGRRRRS